jgi:xylulokinase
VSSLLVGLDLGTSAVKVGVFDTEGNLLRRSRRSYPLYTPHPGWTEQEPEEWWASTCAALGEALAGVEAGRIAAVGLSGQSPSQVLLADDGTALGRAIVWSDRRATLEAEWLAERITPEQAEVWTDCAFVTGVNQPPARLLWLRTHRSDDWARCAAVIQPKDYIAYQLTGEIATDVNSALGLYNPQSRQYSPDLLRLLDVDPSRMPPVLGQTAITGHVKPGAAAATGLQPGVPVITGTIDAWCDIIGCVGIAPGSAVDVAGTSEVVALTMAELVSGDGVFGAPLANGRYWVGGPMQVGAAALTWLSRCFYGQESPDFRLLESEAMSVAPGAEGLLFLPYLRGERAPVWDPAARGTLFGLTDRHSRAHCTRAVYEGVAYAVRDLLERCKAVAVAAPKAVRVSGGGSASDFWNQVKADIIGLPVQRVAVLEAACLGAAVLAAAGVGLFDGLEQASEAMIRVGETFDPIAAHVSRYESMFATWRLLYPTLRPLFQRLSVR